MPNTLHICLVSNQLQPSVIAWRELKPERTLLLASGKVEAEAMQLMQIARDMGLKAERYAEAIPTDSYAHLREYFLELATELPTDTDIFVNLTGGTKLMTLAAADVLADEGYQFFYTDTDNRQIEFLNLDGTGSTLPPRAFSAPLDSKQLISCGMASIRHTGTTDPRHKQRLIDKKTLIENFARTAINNVSSISKLNWYMAKHILTENGQALKQSSLQLDQTLENAFRKVLTDANDSNLLHYNVDTATVHFRSVDDARWLHGLWLEEFVWWQMRNAGLKHYDTGVELQWQMPDHKARQLPANEIDAIASHDNRLCIVECKTGKLEHEGRQDVIHKLSRLSAQLAGPFGKAILVSLHVPGSSIADRARHSNIAIVCGQQLLNLKQSFRDWIADQ